MGDVPSIAYLDTYGNKSSNVCNHDLYKGLLERVDIYDIDQASFDQYKAIIIPVVTDEEFLYLHKGKISDYLNHGGIVVSFAQIFRPWLPGNTLWRRSGQSIKERFIQANPDHPLFKGVTEYDMNYRRGVKGFFSRGYFIPPAGAETALRDNQGKCVVYIDRMTTPGTILAGAGTDLLGYGLGQTTTARRIGVQLIDWIERESKKTGKLDQGQEKEAER